MAKYELEDNLVVSVLKQCDGQTKAGDPLDTLLNQLTQQLTPLPTARYAVVQDHEGTVWVRVGDEPGDDVLNWRSAGPEWGDSDGGQWITDAQVPRPFYVEFRGVES